MALYRLSLAVSIGAACAYYTPPTRRRVALRNTALNYADSDAAVDSSSDRAVDALRAKGDTAAVKALQADIADIVVMLSLIHI